jgi:hypothetical protein
MAQALAHCHVDLLAWMCMLQFKCLCIQPLCQTRTVGCSRKHCLWGGTPPVDASQTSKTAKVVASPIPEAQELRTTEPSVAMNDRLNPEQNLPFSPGWQTVATRPRSAITRRR